MLILSFIKQLILLLLLSLLWKRKYHKRLKITKRLFYVDKQLCLKTANKHICRTVKWPMAKPSTFL